METVLHLNSGAAGKKLGTTTLHLIIESPTSIYIPLDSENSHVHWEDRKTQWDSWQAGVCCLCNPYLKDGGMLTGSRFSHKHFLFPEPDLGSCKNGCKAVVETSLETSLKRQHTAHAHLHVHTSYFSCLSTAVVGGCLPGHQP